jgi:hypothetical protein
VIADPLARGRALAGFFLATSPRLFAELEESGVLPATAPRAEARLEWECFALYACVRGLVAAGGFNRETAAAIDAMHGSVLETWEREGDAAARRARVAERYSEYGGIGQEHGAAGAASVSERLGRAAARHLAGAPAEGPLAEIAGQLHEALAEGAADAVREAR